MNLQIGLSHWVKKKKTRIIHFKKYNIILNHFLHFTYTGQVQYSVRRLVMNMHEEIRTLCCAILVVGRRWWETPGHFFHHTSTGVPPQPWPISLKTRTEVPISKLASVPSERNSENKLLIFHAMNYKHFCVSLSVMNLIINSNLTFKIVIGCISILARSCSACLLFAQESLAKLVNCGRCDSKNWSAWPLKAHTKRRTGFVALESISRFSDFSLFELHARYVLDVFTRLLNHIDCCSSRHGYLASLVLHVGYMTRRLCNAGFVYLNTHKYTRRPHEAKAIQYLYLI